VANVSKTLRLLLEMRDDVRELREDFRRRLERIEKHLGFDDP
jgi:hypothetical protein